MSGNEFDAFSDIVNNDTGIFGAEAAGLAPALRNFDNAQTAAAQDGLHVTMYCRGCGRTIDVCFGYHELVACKYRCPPQAAYQGTQFAVATEYKWSAPHGAFFPVTGCASCQTPCSPLITPDEAETHLARARANGWIDPRIEQQLAVRAAEAAKPYRAQLVQTGHPIRR